MILGVATTLRVPGTTGGAIFVAVLLVVVELRVEALAVVVVPVELLVRTMGSVEGIGLPSFVCSLSTWTHVAILTPLSHLMEDVSPFSLK